MDSKLIEQINELLLAGRSQLKKDAATDIKNKLLAKRETLKENFIVNLPSNYNNEKELLELVDQIDNLKASLHKLKAEHVLLSQFINKKGIDSSKISDELSPFVIKSIHIKRQLAYTNCLIRIEELKANLDENLIELNGSLKIEKPQQTDKKVDKNEWCLHLLKQNELFETTIDTYLELKEMLESINSSKCTHLLNYLIGSIEIYHEKLKKILTNELEEKLKSINYPFIVQADSEKKPIKNKAQQLANEQHEAQLNIAKEQNESKIKLCIGWLLKIEYFHLLTQITEKKDHTITSNKSLIIKILTNPLEKRFKYHFSGNKKTNNLEKPEWYLSQILKWIKIHEDFLVNFIQPIFEQNSVYKGKSIIVDFVNCFINLIKQKIDFDLILLISDKFQFSHTIDELLLFDAQLKNYLKELMIYDNVSFVSCMNVLCKNEDFFFNWLYLERLLCTKKIDQMFAFLNRTNLVNLDSMSLTENKSTEKPAQTMLSLNEEKSYFDIWQCNYSDVDKMKPPHCAETFMAMIKAISDRFSELSHHQSKKLKFVALQLELINDFHMRLCQIIRDETKAPFGKIYLGVLNAVNYIINIIEEWKNSTFYIEMHYVKSRFVQYANKNKAKMNEHNSNENEWENEIELCRQFDNQFLNNETAFYNMNSLFDLNGTLFDDVLSSYEKIKDEMLGTLIQNCLWEIKTRSRNYKKEKWTSMPSFSDFYKITLTQSAADMLISLKNLLNLLRESLAQYLFESAVKKIVAELDKFFYEDIILNNQFNDGGVSQLDHDFNKYLLPIINEYMLNDAVSDGFFRKTKEALILLKLKQGPAILIKDIIKSALHDDSAFQASSDLIKLNAEKEQSSDEKRIQLYNARNALKEFNVIQLTCEQAEELLSLRSYGETI